MLPLRRYTRWFCQGEPSVRLIRGWPVQSLKCGGVTIGHFDGVHRGHKALIAQAASVDGPTAVLTFEPHANEYFRPEDAPPRLYRFREKMELLSRETEADIVCVLRFNRRLASLSADEFLDQVLRCFQPEQLVVGHDFRYGANRLGDTDHMRRRAKQVGVDVHVAEPIKAEGLRISSTAVRDALKTGDLAAAKELLGRPYCIGGRVVYGRQLGRDLGFPTANLPLRRLHSPLHGVYAVRVHGDGWSRYGVANIGSRPTVDGKHWMLEVHLFDYSGELYGQRVSVEFCLHIRDEQKFDGLDLMVAQIMRDADQARDFFGLKKS